MFSGGTVFCCLFSAAVAFGDASSVQEPVADGPVLTEAEMTKYVTVILNADLSHLTDKEKEIIRLLIEAAQEMDEAFWIQAWGDRDAKLATIPEGKLRDFAMVNYGPWDRLQNLRSFVPGVGAKPAGANFYPADMTKEEFLAAVEENPSLGSLYTFVRREDDGKLVAVPYSKLLAKQLSAAASKLRHAAGLSDNKAFAAYLVARADALESGAYQHSDLLWMDMKDNRLDMVIGPIETYEDQLFGKKAACEAYVLVKDMEWSGRLQKYAALLPGLQKKLPVAEEYRSEKPGTDADLNAYDVIYYAGDCNAGSKTIAINLPNDEKVQLEKGSRRLQLKNAMQAKYDQILVPIADLLIDPSQRKHIKFNAFFSNTMFHEVAHGLGIKNTITGNGTVREALREASGSIEEGKADILGLFMVTQLLESGDLTEGELADYYVTFVAGIFRSVRFGASSAHGRANMVCFNFLSERGAFSRDDKGRYIVDVPKMKIAVGELAGTILKLQGKGDYAAAREFSETVGQIGPVLKADLERVNREGIPTDVVFVQGPKVLGLNHEN